MHGTLGSHEGKGRANFLGEDVYVNDVIASSNHLGKVGSVVIQSKAKEHKAKAER